MVKVYVQNNPAGNLWRSDTVEGQYFFSYDAAQSAQDAVSLTMPLIADPYAFNYKHQLHPIFDMNLPEGELGRRLRQQFGKVIPNFDDLSLLEIVGNSQIGRLRFARDGASIPEIPAQSVNALITHDGAEGLFNDLLDRYAIHSGISGVQPKVMLRNADEESFGHLTHRDATHIVKAWTADYPCLAANEYFCLRAAEKAGIPVPPFKLSELGVFLIIERFDLDIRSGQYLGFEDFCVLNAQTSDQKYQGSYEGIARRITDFVSSEQIPEALEQYFKMLTLTCMLRNGDAHLKNFGVLYSHTEGKVGLAPAYDIVTTTAYLPNDSLALTLAGSKRWPKPYRLLEFGRQHCHLSRSKAIGLLDQIREAVEATSQELQAYKDSTPDFQEIGSRMLAAWEAGQELATLR